MKLKELLSEVRVLECTAALETEIRDISFDSRTTQPGVPPARISSVHLLHARHSRFCSSPPFCRISRAISGQASVCRPHPAI